MDFPNLGRFDLLYKSNAPLHVEGLSFEGSILKRIEQKRLFSKCTLSVFFRTLLSF